MTITEKLLWQRLRGKQLGGRRFRKQHPVQWFVLDFYCPAARLGIELDGAHHNSEDARARDAERTAVLEGEGIRILRFWNHEVTQDLERVLATIAKTLEGPHPSPPPLGEGADDPSDDLAPPPSGGRLGGGPASGIMR